MEPERREIVEYLIKTDLVHKCIFYQTIKCRDRQLVADLEQECWLWIMTYDIAKLCDAYDKNHMNALISRWIINNYFSKSSPFYKNFRKFQELTDDLSPKEFNIPAY